jgi:isopropylmalate/homocitrate/citramalate synthase
MERHRITFFDTTLRDGEQAPGCSMGVYDKLRMAHQLDALGADVIEAGFPVASEDDFRAVRMVRMSLIFAAPGPRWSMRAIRVFTYSLRAPICICSAS